MKSKARLDSAVFQLTPTRTRCDLVIVANGKTEKIASGLLDPFLAHLKTAQDQVAKGGYSITLEPKPGSDAEWFTKGTMDRFVRFVNTPEVLERVNTIESEIIQIDESIRMQANESLALSTQVEVQPNKVEDHPSRYRESNEGTKNIQETETEKAIVLYKPEAISPKSNGSARPEENSKVQLLKVLETRKGVLQKEQAMAFARATAAGFEMDHIAQLISFGESFGATRLVEACLKFLQLWKEKHETGQWIDIDSTESTSNRSDFSSLIAPNGAIALEMKKHNETKEVWPESSDPLSNESNGKANNDTSAEKRNPLDAQSPGNHAFYQGQYQHPMFPQWTMQSPPGAPPGFQPYPMNGMPYYQNYPGSGSFFQPPYPPMEDPRFNSTQKKGLRRHSMDSKDGNIVSESGEMGVYSMRAQDASDFESEGSRGRQLQRKSGRSSKKQTVVIRNINYITSKEKNASESESTSASDSQMDDDSEGVLSDAQEIKHKNSKSLGTGGKSSNSIKISNSHGKGQGNGGEEADGENWQAFQKFLLRNDDKGAHNTDHDMFSMEKGAQVSRRKNKTGTDPILSSGHTLSEDRDGRMLELDGNGDRSARMLRTSSDELVASGRDYGGEHSERQAGLNLTHLGERGGYRRGDSDDFIIRRQENHLGLMNTKSDPLAGYELEHTSGDLDKRSHKVIDESFVVPLRSGVHDPMENDSRTALDMDVEFPVGMQNKEDPSSRFKNQVSYEPEDLSLILERGTERESTGYDPAIDYEMQVQAVDTDKVLNKNQDDALSQAEGGEKNLAKGKKLKSQDSLEKRKAEAAAKKGKPSKFSPSTEAQARAAKLRAFKADLQKMKKQNEEEEIKRLEGLKRERQMRIAGRGNSTPAQTQLPSQMKPRLPTKLSPNPNRGPKFSDSEPGSYSPTQSLPIRTASLGPNESENIIKPSRLNNSGRLAVNGLTRSVSSLPEMKKAKGVTTPEPKELTARMRRLSEPKTSTIPYAAPSKLRGSDPVSKSKVTGGAEIKKISAIMSLDKTKAATLPELKIRTPPQESEDPIQKKQVAKDVAQKANGTRPSVASGNSKINKKAEHISPTSSGGNDSPIIEKAVVMLESETHTLPSIQRSKERPDIRKTTNEEDTSKAKPKLVSEYAAIHAPVSPQTTSEVAQNPSEFQFNNQPILHEVEVDRTAEIPNISSISITEKPYQAPYARNSSIEDHGTTKLESTGVTKVIKAATSKDTASDQVSDIGDHSALEESLESSEKHQGKESSKGFKRLLKFARKNTNSSAGERPVESDKLNTNGSLGDNHSTSFTSEVHTLKNLISQDETPTASNSHKASRHFSLLSPFRSKTSEKKLTT